jgi:hypothetical protein
VSWATRSSAPSAIAASPHIRAGFDAALIRLVFPCQMEYLCPVEDTVCTNLYLHRRSAGKGQSVPLSYHYLYPLRTGHLRVRHSEGPRTPLPTLLLPPHAHTSSCLSLGRRQHFDRGDYPGFVIYHTCIARLKNVPAVRRQLLASTFPDLTTPPS